MNAVDEDDDAAVLLRATRAFDDAASSHEKGEAAIAMTAAAADLSRAWRSEDVGRATTESLRAERRSYAALRDQVRFSRSKFSTSRCREDRLARDMEDELGAMIERRRSREASWWSALGEVEALSIRRLDVIDREIAVRLSR